MMNKKWIVAALLISVLPALACSFSFDLAGETPVPPIATPQVPTDEVPPQPTPTATLPALAGPSFSNIFFAAGVTDAGEPVDVAVDFPPETTIVYAFASYEGMTDLAECDSVWYLDGQEIWRDAFQWGVGESGQTAIAHVEGEGGLPSGGYDWELYVEGDLAVSGSFTVQGAVAALLEDDFSDPGSGWEVGDYDTGSVGYQDGIYFVTSLGGGDMMWGVASRSFDNLVIEVDATQVSAPANDNNAYGVMCRLQLNDDGYLMRISGDGFYSLYKIVAGEFEALVDWAESDAIRQGNATNRIVATCDGSDLVLSVNGEVLVKVFDSTFPVGDIALTATSFEEGESTEIHFDNLLVSAP